MTTTHSIRPVALCVFRRANAILVSRGQDPANGETFFRPLGGGIEFGERSDEATRREIREELGAEVKHLSFLGTLENIFKYKGRPCHEIVFVYDGRLMDDALYAKAVLHGTEADGSPLEAVWKPLEDFHDDHPPLYPHGLLELLRANVE